MSGEAPYGAGGTVTNEGRSRQFLAVRLTWQLPGFRWYTDEFPRQGTVVRQWPRDDHAVAASHR